jgi:PAS domain S-box-containing protein
MNVITVGRKKLDVFFILISFFMIILTFLIIYINKADRDMKNYTIYHKQIKELSTLNQQIENNFLQKYRYIDYDQLQSISAQFEETLSYLDQQKFVYKFDKALKEEIAKLYDDYKQKDEYVQQFKSTNSRLTNSVHYLFDLHQNISNDINISDETKELFANTFFQIEQFAMDIPSDPKILQGNINKIKTIKSEHEFYPYFYRHANLFLKDIILLKNILEKNRRLALDKQIQRVSQELERHSNEMYETQYKISLIFFIFGFLNLVFLIVNYKKINKLVQDLFTFKYTIENSDNLIVITDKNRKIEYVNEAFERKLGYSKEELIGQQPNIIKSEMMSDRFYQNLNETLDRGEKWEGEIINRRKDGSLIYEKASITPIINKDKVQGYLSIKLDISEYIDQHNQLKRFQTLFEYTQDAVLILNEYGTILLVNPAFLALTSYTQEHIYKAPLSSVLTQTYQDVFNEETKTITQRERLYTQDVELLTKTQNAIPQSMTIISLSNNYNLINYVVIFKD